ncbi:hypothetical protein [Sphingomonas sp. KR3-1]|uniref:hypothetical protein n=1 Tax=Sphingomonas sp. KR3-1 TaxID=3156611 RepID=UPI0032B59836
MAGLSAKERSRSPRFPSYPLSEAVSYAERIYEGVHRSAVDASTAFQLMGFRGRSGASATALGAIRQFGLIEGIGENTRISDLALRILEPSSSLERAEALKIAAQEPDVFRLILERFDGRVPPADEPVRAFLIRDLGFSKGGAEDCLTSLRKTVDYVNSLAGANLPATIPIEAGTDNPVENQDNLNSNRPKKSAAPENNRTYRIPLTRECEVELEFQGEVTERAVSRLILHIELMKEIWTEEQ